MAKQRFLRKGKEFFSQRLWEIDPAELRPGKRFLLRSLQVVTAVGREFFADNCLLHASALAFTTLLSFIPFLAVTFALLKGFGAANDLEILILNHLALGSEELIDAIFTYISNTNLANLGIFGIISLLITVLTLLINIEQSFNHIWRVSETRPLPRLFSDYFSITVFGPILILAAISMTTTLESQTLVKHLLNMEVIGQALFLLFKVFPYLAMWAVFTALYLYIPNTRIDLRAALIGGAFGGFLWQMLQWGYVTFQFGVSRYNAIYGTMAALPIFMIWIYISWVIVLLGLEVTFAVQNIRTIRQEFRGDRLSVDARETATLAILLTAAQAFVRGEPPLGAEDFSLRLNLAPRFSRQILGFLVRRGLLNEVTTHKAATNSYQPACDIDTLTVQAILDALRHDGDELKLVRMGAAGRVVGELHAALDGAQAQAVVGITLRELVVRMWDGGDGTAEGTEASQAGRIG